MDVIFWNRQSASTRLAPSRLPTLLGGSAALTLSALVGALPALRVGLWVHVLPVDSLVEEIEVGHDILEGPGQRLARRVLFVRHFESE